MDEVGFNLSIRPSHGRAYVGNRAEDEVDNLRSRNITVMAASYTGGKNDRYDTKLTKVYHATF